MSELDLKSSEPAGAAAVLAALVQGDPDERTSLGALVDRLEERAFGLMLLLLALPCAVPFLYGVPQIMSAPMLFIAAQAFLGRRTLWLPDAFRARSLRLGDLQAVQERAKPWLVRLEFFAHPRLAGLTGRGFERLFGLVMLIGATSIAVPLPLTNTVPGIGLAILAVGMIERDGLLMLAGSVLTLAWVVMLLTVGSALIVWVTGLV